MNNPNFIRPGMTGDMGATPDTLANRGSDTHSDPKQLLGRDEAVSTEPPADSSNPRDGVTDRHHNRVPDGGKARLDVDKTPTEEQSAILSGTKPIADQGTSEADPTIRDEQDALQAHGGAAPD